MDEDISPVAVDDGIKIMEDMLYKWASDADGEDVMMSEDGLSPEVQLQDLQKYLETYHTRIEGNQWLQSVIASL